MLEASANTLFGASSQTLTSMAASASHGGDMFNADASFKFRYGESEDDEGVKFVSARGWAASLRVDGTPKGRFSPFVSVDGEASLEKRIANRRSLGVGANAIVAKSPTGAATLSFGLLGERTATLGDSATIPETVETLARWSWRVKVDEHVGDKVSMSHVTVYGPAFNAPAQYTVTTTTMAAYSLTKTMAFTLTLTDNYDSQAQTRGAPSNNDGSLLFGVRSAF